MIPPATVATRTMPNRTVPTRRKLSPTLKHQEKLEADPMALAVGGGEPAVELRRARDDAEIEGPEEGGTREQLDDQRLPQGSGLRGFRHLAAFISQVTLPRTQLATVTLSLPLQ